MNAVIYGLSGFVIFLSGAATFGLFLNRALEAEKKQIEKLVAIKMTESDKAFQDAVQGCMEATDEVIRACSSIPEKSHHIKTQKTRLN